MTVYLPPEFEAEVLDLDRVPDESEFFPDDPTHWLGGYDGEIRLVGTRRKYKALIRIGEDPTGMVCIDILTLTDIARERLAEHAERDGLLKVTIGAITFTARIFADWNYEAPSLGELFCKAPEYWGARGDPYLWSDMRDLLSDTPPPRTIAGLEEKLRSAFTVLTGHDVDEADLFFVERYDKGGTSSGYVSPQRWREHLIPLLGQRLLWAMGWDKPDCRSCGSAKVVRIEYGMPTPEMIEAAGKNAITLGGCVLSSIDPDWHCLACDHRW